MQAFNIKYRNADDQTIKQETIFMGTLTGAKVSTAAFAPSGTESIVITNSLDLVVATERNGKWSKES
ncbi:hypothetical protein [Vibrio sp. ER1A]|uniref:hypothetical protein n=1 Tax=Vibrio sp. ER1A TaxID=1517681 RepID=UPI0004DD68F2|nr:hypothetical protein [Vibrio sp. ER1A]KFA99602.1 hypothetical protein HW45_02760 [Vibrio sp. ER1A]